MKAGFYSKIACGNIRKNYRFFIPRMIAEAGLLGVFYIVFTLKADERIAAVKGGAYLPVFLSIGTAVMMILSTILIFYTNSFLMKQRKREFGLYNILGMEKRHVGRVLFYETAVSGVITVLFGLGLGVLFYKACSLLICRLLNTEIILGFYFITAKSLVYSALFFVLLDLLTYLFNRIAIARMKPVELLQSRAAGEKEPRVKRLMLILGLLSLGGGYYISMTTESPLRALMLFFVAVILVIIGTYFIFVSGSIFVLKALKKNERFYYGKNHMPAVSGLLYRMKQNAVGLASIAILATGVLVMISTTVSLYSGMQQTLDNNYPQHYYVSADYLDENEKRHTIPFPVIEDMVNEAAESSRAEIKRTDAQKYLDVAYDSRNGRLSARRPDVNFADNLAGLTKVTFITEETFVQLGGEALGLGKDEAAICSLSGTDGYGESTIVIDNNTYKVTKELLHFPIRGAMISSINCYGMVVADDEALDAIYRAQKEKNGDAASEYTNRLAVTFADAEKACEAGREIDRKVSGALLAHARSENGGAVSAGGTDSLWAARESVYGMYGALLFLGILLGLVCLFATALIIYYKQISEGYEDRARFQIMQKIGMSADEVKKTINRQIVFVFFLPLVVAGVHLAFAFPILARLLHILLLSSTRLFVGCSIAVYVLFAIVYILIYRTTAKTYYKIVH